MSAENGFVSNASNLMKKYSDEMNVQISEMREEFTGEVKSVKTQMDAVQESVKEFVEIGTATDTKAGLVMASDDVSVDGKGKMSIVDKNILKDDVDGTKYKMGVSDGGLYYEEVATEAQTE